MNELNEAITRWNNESPAPIAPSKFQRLLSRGMDTVLLKALEPDRRHRYRTSAEFRADWRLVRTGGPPNARRVGPIQRLARSSRRHMWGTAAILVVAGLLTTIGVLLWLNQGDSPLATTPSPLRNVHVTTAPPGARVTLVPLDAFNELQPERALRSAAGEVTPLVLSNVSPGNYLLIAEIPGFGFHEVYRTIPKAGQVGESVLPHQRWTERDDGSINLAEIRIPPSTIENGMVRFSGGAFVMGPEVDDGPTFQRNLAAFLIDPYEVTIREYRESGIALPTAIAERLETSRPDYKELPVTGISFDEAVACAERLGKRVPLESEYEFVATMGGTRLFPWGDDVPTGSWTIGPVRAATKDRTPTEPPVFGLYSNAAEWVDTEFLPYDSRLSRGSSDYPAHLMEGLRSTRVVRGAPPFVVSGLLTPPDATDTGTTWKSPHCRQRKPRHMNLPAVGFRCARSAVPRVPTTP